MTLNLNTAILSFHRTLYFFSVSHSLHKLPVSCTCKEAAFNGDRFAKGERSKRVLIQYNRPQLLDMTPARLTPDLISHLRSLQIGVDLPRKRSRRGGRRKQKQPKQGNHLPPSSLSLTERSISDDQDLVENSRSDIPVRITRRDHRTPAGRQSGVNFSNLMSITTQDNQESTHQTATKSHDLVVDTNVDVLTLTEMWLYSHGDEAYISPMALLGCLK